MALGGLAMVELVLEAMVGHRGGIPVHGQFWPRETVRASQRGAPGCGKVMEVQRWWPILPTEWRWSSASRKGKEGSASGSVT